MKKKIILSIIVILVCFIDGYVVYRNYKIKDIEKNADINNNGEVAINKEANLANEIIIGEEKFVGNYKITNIKFNCIGVDEYEFLADIENLESTLVDSKNVDISVLNESGEVISIFGGIIKPLMSNEKGVLKSYVLGDLTGAKSVEFNIIED